MIERRNGTGMYKYIWHMDMGMPRRQVLRHGWEYISVIWEGRFKAFVV